MAPIPHQPGEHHPSEHDLSDIEARELFNQALPAAQFPVEEPPSDDEDFAIEGYHPREEIYPDGIPPELRDAEIDDGPRAIGPGKILAWIAATVLIVAVPLAYVMSL
ncbi:hypothetical protein [Kocuria sp. HSID16901]|uniref:hypothetical protein n=1 Tax=Kocuria sp. HSID16901 TaxID=2419505 RepID=UPI000660FE80|nr:hypothetical protein [Kocuria sp. HSID16901]MCT1368029.1 hypothetical protein [Rothia sp. p3-SID1597]RUQ21702.1 hypothetical protein D8M21_05235 [Kocuria sp. HSID16901]